MAEQLQKSPQVFIIGKITGAQNFDADTMFLRYSFKTGENWKLMSGKDSGDTYQSSSSHGKLIPFEHPIDLNYVSQSIRGWPKILLEAWKVDDENRNSLAGYGELTIPISPGQYKLVIPCWQPKSDFFDELIGAYGELLYKDILVSSDSRFGLKTQSSGKIILDVSILLKDFNLHGIKNN